MRKPKIDRAAARTLLEAAETIGMDGARELIRLIKSGRTREQVVAGLEPYIERAAQQGMGAQ
jgi:N-acetylglucosamine kinase-like BadF-type ATPase